VYWGRSLSLNTKYKSYTPNSAAHPCQVSDFITCPQGSIPWQLLGRENCPMNLDMLSIYLVSPKCSPIFGIKSMTLNVICSLLAAANSIIGVSEMERCHKKGGYCYFYCFSSHKKIGSCFPEWPRCCKNIKWLEGSIWKSSDRCVIDVLIKETFFLSLTTSDLIETCVSI
jgi:hypothetical protein